VFKYSDCKDPAHECELEKRKKERIENIDRIYKPWELHMWNFTGGDINKLNATPLLAIDVMREAYSSYISDSFNSTILLSSIAVETMTHFIIMLHGKQDCTEINDYEISSYDVNTVDGLKKYGFYNNRFGEFIVRQDQGACFCELDSLNKAIEKCKQLNYDISSLDKRVKKDAECILEVDGPRLFVVRRDTLVHGNFEGLALTQEIVDIEEGKYKDQEELVKKVHELYTHEPQVFEQYKAASEFIMSTFKKFNEEYGYR